jgi:hypothetical protein
MKRGFWPNLAGQPNTTGNGPTWNILCNCSYLVPMLRNEEIFPKVVEIGRATIP